MVKLLAASLSGPSGHRLQSLGLGSSWAYPVLPPGGVSRCMFDRVGTVVFNGSFTTPSNVVIPIEFGPASKWGHHGLGTRPTGGKELHGWDVSACAGGRPRYGRRRSESRAAMAGSTLGASKCRERCEGSRSGVSRRFLVLLGGVLCAGPDQPPERHRPRDGVLDLAQLGYQKSEFWIFGQSHTYTPTAPIPTTGSSRWHPTPRRPRATSRRDLSFSGRSTRRGSTAPSSSSG